MVDVFDNYFQTLFKTSDPTRSFIHHCIDKSPVCVTFDMNAVLLARYS